jgi:hypothetical protein
LVVSLAYVVVCRLFSLLVLFGRGDRSKELEILVLRYQLAVMRRQVERPRFSGCDRLLLAAFSRMLPRRSWKAFMVPRRSCAGIGGSSLVTGHIPIGVPGGPRSTASCGS